MGKCKKTQTNQIENILLFINPNSIMTENQNKYCQIREFKENRAAVCFIDKNFFQPKKFWGFIDTDGNEIIPCIYLKVSDFVNNEALVIYNSRYSIDSVEQTIDLNGNLKTDKLENLNFIPYNQICEFSNFCFKVEKSGKWGLIDKKGRQILECQFAYIWDLEENGAVVSSINRKMTSLECNTKELSPFYFCGLISDKGEILIPQKYISFQSIYAEFYIVKRKISYKNYPFQSFGYGLYDVKKQQLIVSCFYNSLKYIDNNLFEVSLKVISNNITNNSSELYSSKDKSVINYVNILGLLHINGKCVLTNKGELQFLSYDMAYEREDKYYSVYLNSKQGIIDCNGKLILEPKYKTIGLFIEGIAINSIEISHEEKSNNYSDNLLLKFGLTNENGFDITKFEFDEIKEFKCGLARVKKNEKYGFIDKTGKKIIDCIFSEASEFKNNRAIVKTQLQGENVTKLMHYYGILDVTGDYIINHFDYINSLTFNDELFIVEKNNKKGGINNDGIFIIPLIYDYIDIFRSEDELIIAKLNEKYGALNYYGETIIPFIYNNLNGFSDGLARFETVNENGIQKIGYINKENEIIIPAIYDDGYDFHDGVAYVKVYLDTSNSRFEKYVEILIDKKGIELEREEMEDEIYDEYCNNDFYDEDSSNNNSHYNDGLDMDQQSKEYWEDLGLY